MRNEFSTDRRTCQYYKNKRWWLNFLIEFIVFALIGWSWYVYVILIGFDILEKEAVKASLFIVFYHLFIVLLLISMLRTTFTDPGSVPLHFMNNGVVYERDNSGNPRFCAICNHYKPDRARHCSDCNTCVLKMDHHCPWVNNCVGWRNYKFFCLFIFYTSIACFYIAITCGVVIYDLVISKKMKMLYIQIIALCFIATMLALTISSFSFAHLRLLMSNLTTIESLSKHFVENNIYDVGRIKNIQQVFGRNIFLAFLPIRTSIGDGTTWEHNEKLSAEPIYIQQISNLIQDEQNSHTYEDEYIINIDEESRLLNN